MASVPTVPQLSISGSYDYKVGPEETTRIVSFLSSYPATKKFNSVVVIPDNKWDTVSKDFNLPQGSSRIAFSIPAAGRTYVNARLFKNKSVDQGVEWALAHELEHLNDWRNPTEQEKMDKIIDTSARMKLKQWKDSRK